MKYFSLFSGIGGFEVGINDAYEINNKQQSGCKESESEKFKQGREWLSKQSDSQLRSSNKPTPHCVGYSEIDKHAIRIYESHFPTHHNYGDITKINAEELPDFDLLVGGFPCQSFSIAGKRKGFDDTRGTLFYDICRIAKAKEPMLMLLENVKGLVSHDKGNTLEVILANLQELGYYVNYEIRNSKDYGVPQNRERIFFTCKHIKTISSVGQTERMTISERTIQEWLFQLLLNNLDEVKKRQGLESKDSIVGSLLLREIKEKLLTQDTEKNILDGISTHSEESKFLLQDEEVWQSIDTLLSKKLGVNSSEMNKSTISTAIKQIIESKIYTYSTMLKSILLATVLLRKSSDHLWNEVLSGLILIQENTKYARINNENEEAIITESGTAHLKSELQKNGECFIVGHLRGTSRPEVFPFGEENSISKDLQKKRWISPTQTAWQFRNWSGAHIDMGLDTARQLTPIECERLQGFPDKWTEGLSDNQRYKCLGNAVTTNVIRDVFKKITI